MRFFEASNLAKLWPTLIRVLAMQIRRLSKRGEGAAGTLNLTDTGMAAKESHPNMKPGNYRICRIPRDQRPAHPSIIEEAFLIRGEAHTPALRVVMSSNCVDGD